MLGDIYMLHLGNGRDVASSTAEKERERDRERRKGDAVRSCAESAL